jgi:hypothetical protein
VTRLGKNEKKLEISQICGNQKSTRNRQRMEARGISEMLIFGKIVINSNMFGLGDRPISIADFNRLSSKKRNASQRWGKWKMS